MPQLVEIICRQFLQSIIYPYMNDSLMADSDVDTLEKKCFVKPKEFCNVQVCRLLLEKKFMEDILFTIYIIK